MDIDFDGYTMSYRNTANLFGQHTTFDSWFDSTYTVNNPLSYNSSNNTVDLNYNSTNIKLTNNQLDTIQNIDLSGSPIFSGLKLNGDCKLNSDTATGKKLYFSLSDSNKFSIRLDSNIKFSLYDEGQAQEALVSELYSSKIYFPNGNIGIGTSTPSQKLDVSGNIKCSGINLGDETLSKYDEGTFTLNFSTDGLLINPVNVNVTISYVRIGKNITLRCPGFSANKQNKTPMVYDFVKSDAAIPSDITPTSDIFVGSTVIIDYTTYESSRVKITSSGKLEIHDMNGLNDNWGTNGNSFEVKGFCVSYILN